MPSRDEREWLDRVFGAVLPDATRDERRDRSEPDSDEELASERELRRNVPPHHGQT